MKNKLIFYMNDQSHQCIQDYLENIDIIENDNLDVDYDALAHLDEYKKWFKTHNIKYFEAKHDTSLSYFGRLTFKSVGHLNIFMLKYTNTELQKLIEYLVNYHEQNKIPTNISPTILTRNNV